MSRILMNQAGGKTIVEKTLIAESLSERLRGLLGRKTLPNDTGLLIRPCRSIHMWFMRFPIDAAYLDREMRILKISRNLRPWMLGLAPRKTSCVLETAAGVLDALQPGDQLIEKE